MKKAPLTLGLLGVILSNVISGSAAAGSEEASLKSVLARVDNQAAIALTDMINRGYIISDAETGKLRMQASVVEIMRDYGLAGKDVVSSFESDGGKTTGGSSGGGGGGGM